MAGQSVFMKEGNTLKSMWRLGKLSQNLQVILSPSPALRDFSVPPQGTKGHAGSQSSRARLQGLAHRTGHTQTRTLAQEGAHEAEALIANCWKGPDAPERGGKLASHNGKATDYLNSNPWLPAAPGGPQAHAGRTLRGDPGQSAGNREGSRERQRGRGQPGTEGV